MCSNEARWKRRSSLRSSSSPAFVGDEAPSSNSSSSSFAKSFPIRAFTSTSPSIIPRNFSFSFSICSCISLAFVSAFLSTSSFKTWRVFSFLCSLNSNRSTSALNRILPASTSMKSFVIFALSSRMNFNSRSSSRVCASESFSSSFFAFLSRSSSAFFSSALKSCSRKALSREGRNISDDACSDVSV